jgi:hypothetical protein
MTSTADPNIKKESQILSLGYNGRNQLSFEALSTGIQWTLIKQDFVSREA